MYRCCQGRDHLEVPMPPGPQEAKPRPAPRAEYSGRENPWTSDTLTLAVGAVGLSTPAAPARLFCDAPGPAGARVER